MLVRLPVRLRKFYTEDNADMINPMRLPYRIIDAYLCKPDVIVGLVVYPGTYPYKWLALYHLFTFITQDR